MDKKKDLLLQLDELAARVSSQSAHFHEQKTLLQRLQELVNESGRLHQESRLRQKELAFFLREITFFSENYEPTHRLQLMKQTLEGLKAK